MLFKKDGKDLIVHMNKNGYVFVLDKKTANIENIWPISDLKKRSSNRWAISLISEVPGAIASRSSGTTIFNSPRRQRFAGYGLSPSHQERERKKRVGKKGHGA
jgi:hypothetical protein